MAFETILHRHRVPGILAVNIGQQEPAGQPGDIRRRDALIDSFEFFPTACSSASRSPARWRSIRRCSYWTSHRLV